MNVNQQRADYWLSEASYRLQRLTQRPEREEKKQITLHLAQGCILANVHGVHIERSVPEVLQYLGAESAT
jgi:hypothetical protein